MKRFNYRNPIDINIALETARKNTMANEAAEVDNENLIDEKKDIDDGEKAEKSIKKQHTDIVEPTKLTPSEYFFKNIIFFTNERDSAKNKTLKNLEDAIKGKDIVLTPFIADEVEYICSDDMIKFSDSKNTMKITDQSNVDTIVIVRLGAQKSEECMALIEELQNWGFFVLNPIQNAKKASNKYTSAVLAQRYNIPQPNFTLLTINDIKNGMDSLKKALKKIYKDYGDNDEEDEKREFVVKILDGHGGTGVFMVSGKTILAILQAIFAIDEKRELLLQRKEQGQDGDIRVHVLTMRTKQTILAAMKRKKLGKDFRSNVSLGATAEPIELTEEQKAIALKVAQISGMPWCAVDIMPLVKGSNPEIGDNVVLEWNASPGTDGISEVIKDNFMRILLDNINDINELQLAPKSIGYIENIKIKFNENQEKPVVLEAKMDTGNGSYASTIGVDKIDVENDTITATIDGNEYKFKKHGEVNPIVGQVRETRVTAIIPEIQIGSRKLLNVEFAIVDNRKKSTKVLLNRNVLAKMAYHINPGKKHALEAQFDV